MSGNGAPRVSIIIPTYNRADLLQETLDSLTRQSLGCDEFEVIVSDDGSSDDTAQVARSFEGRLRLRYRFQEDLGFRAAAARNGGARLASAPLLVFIDTGTIAGPGLVQAHLDAQAATPGGCAVAGYAWGYQPWGTALDVGELLKSMTPEQVVEQYRDDPAIWDWRNEFLPDFDLTVNQRTVPWLIWWTINCGVPAEMFWAAEGFDETFRSWGSEDIELGFRLYQAGVPLVACRDAWVIEAPHERDMFANSNSNKINYEAILSKHREPVIELAWWVFVSDSIWLLDDVYRELLAWTEASRALTVGGELAAAAGGGMAGSGGTAGSGTAGSGGAGSGTVGSGTVGSGTVGGGGTVGGDAGGERVAVFGCGADIPASLAGATLIDFDDQVVSRLSAAGHPDVHHAVGLRTPLGYGAADHVIITSRLSGLWERLGDDIMLEANRVGRRVTLLASANQPVTAPAAVTQEPAGEAATQTMLDFLVRQWQGLLDRPDLCADDHFFRNEGTSVQAAHLVGRVKKEFGIKLTLRDVFRAPTPNSLTRLIEAKHGTQLAGASATHAQRPR